MDEDGDWFGKMTGVGLAATDLFMAVRNNESGGLWNFVVGYLFTGSIHGQIPESIFNLSMLQALSLTDNSISGNLPSSIANGLPNLELLLLGGNQLSGEIPASISNFSKLTKLDLGENFFHRRVPLNLGNLLHSLESLYFGINQLTKDPSVPELDFLISLQNCRMLKLIGMENNPFGGILPKSLGNLSTSVENFEAGHCGIKGIILNEIGNLSNLIRLDIGGNELTGRIPNTLGQLRKLQKLILSFNKLRGSASANLCNLVHMYYLDLGNNQLSQQLPKYLGNLMTLREIYLDYNSMTSTIPSTLWNNKEILILSLAHNLFNGSLAQEIGNIKSIKSHMPESFGSLISLKILDLSKNKLDGVIPKSMEKLEYLENFNVSFNELIVKFPMEGLLRTSSQIFSWAIETCVEHLNLSRKTLLQALSTSPFTIKRISYSEVLDATKKFGEENLIGKGSVGTLYKGVFSDGMIAAIKVFNLDLEEANNSIDSECQILCNIRHRNLVKVISSFSNLHLKALVLEYMPHGNLTKWIFSSNYFLNIAQRLEIMIDVAFALEYLHHGNPYSIVHCDLKPSNILLDDDMVAHVVDFGIAKLLSEDQRILLTKTLGTIGYMASGKWSLSTASICIVKYYTSNYSPVFCMLTVY
ncbi:receptor kinase-like protein Xa21 [Olea europaea var. sylvestris]|uniref:receptor kinase-like protein Xa21 n=1 Tax=Olea europaea var. sylvestris TaxID=158386 RepID=UPI000C1D3209|nr:receptor kinase-like protein Xa21 [Olea europaea var. sylvestris]